MVAEGKARWTPVTIRGAAGDKTAVEGVEVDAQVIVLGQNNVREGTPVRVSEAP